MYNFNSFPSKCRLRSFPLLLKEKYLYLVLAFITGFTMKLDQGKHVLSGGAAKKLVLLFWSLMLTFKSCVGIKRPYFLQNKTQLFLMKTVQKPFILTVWTSYTLLLYRQTYFNRYNIVLKNHLLKPTFSFHFVNLKNCLVSSFLENTSVKPFLQNILILFKLIFFSFNRKLFPYILIGFI